MSGVLSGQYRMCWTRSNAECEGGYDYCPWYLTREGKQNTNCSQMEQAITTSAFDAKKREYCRINSNDMICRCMNPYTKNPKAPFSDLEMIQQTLEGQNVMTEPYQCWWGPCSSRGPGTPLKTSDLDAYTCPENACVQLNLAVLSEAVMDATDQGQVLINQVAGCGGESAVEKKETSSAKDANAWSTNTVLLGTGIVLLTAVVVYSVIQTV